MGVLTGSDVQKLFDLAKKKNFAIPAVNVVGSKILHLKKLFLILVLIILSNLHISYYFSFDSLWEY